MKRCQVGLVRESEVGTNIYPDYKYATMCTCPRAITGENVIIAAHQIAPASKRERTNQGGDFRQLLKDPMPRKEKTQTAVLPACHTCMQGYPKTTRPNKSPTAS